MRKPMLSMLLLAALLALPVISWGQSKVGVIHLQEAISMTAEGKKAFADLQKKYQPRQADLQRQQQEIQALGRTRSGSTAHSCPAFAAAAVSARGRTGGRRPQRDPFACK